MINLILYVGPIEEMVYNHDFILFLMLIGLIYICYKGATRK